MTGGESIDTHYFITKSGGESSLIEELKGELGKTASLEKFCPQLVKLRTEQDLSHLPLTFAQQSLPHSILIPAGSISEQAQQIGDTLGQKASQKSKWRFHVYALTDKYGVYTGGRSEVLRKKLLKQNQNSLPKVNQEENQKESTFDQVLILPDRQILLSHLEAEHFRRYHSILSPFVGGFKHIEDDPSPPSRAFKKLIEAQSVWGKFIQRGESVIDLGASPGGWTHVAKDQGARVTSIDRSPLSPSLMDDPAVTFQKGDAFKFRAKSRVDWLISDVIAYPERVHELIDTWIANPRCHKFIITLKFQGQTDFDVLKEIKKKTRAHTREFLLKQLNHNKHEATLMGELP